MYITYRLLLCTTYLSKFPSFGMVTVFPGNYLGPKIMQWFPVTSAMFLNLGSLAFLITALNKFRQRDYYIRLITMFRTSAGNIYKCTLPYVVIPNAHML